MNQYHYELTDEQVFDFCTVKLRMKEFYEDIEYNSYYFNLEKDQIEFGYDKTVKTLIKFTDIESLCIIGESLCDENHLKIIYDIESRYKAIERKRKINLILNDIN